MVWQFLTSEIISYFGQIDFTDASGGYITYPIFVANIFTEDGMVKVIGSWKEKGSVANSVFR